ncbi:MAG: hypothetical protein OYK82_09000 [Gammaproteobacteria bacterium]|nr:hypothetical protein [Gammaproteobacteria bacterium]
MSGRREEMVRCLGIAALVAVVSAMVAAGPTPLEGQEQRETAVGADRRGAGAYNWENADWAPMMLRDYGRPIVPVFEGWFQNEDGTYTLVFGYASFNLSQAYDIPLGPDNFIEPAEFDGVQPTHFAPVHPVIRRPWGAFTMVVPEDFGDRRVVWTVRHEGVTYSTPGHITAPSYMISDKIHDSRYRAALAGATQVDVVGSYAPELRFGASGPGGQGLAGIRAGPLSATVGEPLAITTWVDMGSMPDAWIWWNHYAGGPGEVSFSPPESQIPLVDGQGEVTTDVRFSEPGRYVLLVQAIEHLRNTFEYHCCWTNGYVEVNVTN